MPAPPLLVLVNGVPGAGKTTVVAPLGRRLGMPVIAKDRIKERLYMQAPVGAREGLAASRRLGAAAVHAMFRAARRELRAGRAVVLDCSLSRSLDGPRIEAWRAAGLCVPFEIRVVATPTVVLARRRRRAGRRHPAHHSQDALQATTAIERSGSWLFPTGPSIEIDTERPGAATEGLVALVAAVEAAARDSV